MKIFIKDIDVLVAVEVWIELDGNKAKYNAIVREADQATVAANGWKLGVPYTRLVGMAISGAANQQAAIDMMIEKLIQNVKFWSGKKEVVIDD
jgi:nucleoside phosphorylase